MRHTMERIPDDWTDWEKKKIAEIKYLLINYELKRFRKLRGMSVGLMNCSLVYEEI